MASILLALSTFRQSDKAVELAIEKALETRELIIVFIVDVNLARYLVGSDLGLYPKLKDKCEQEVLDDYLKQAEEQVRIISERAEKLDISVKKQVKIGRFGIECLKVVEKEKPALIVTTRSKRPAWVKKLFGSAVDYLKENARCPVLEA